jgi:hypothetical protein
MMQLISVASVSEIHSNNLTAIRARTARPQRSGAPFFLLNVPHRFGHKTTSQAATQRTAFPGLVSTDSMSRSTLLVERCSSSKELFKQKVL